MNIQHLGLAAILGLSLFIASPVSAQTYTVVDLGVSTADTAINASGQVLTKILVEDKGYYRPSLTGPNGIGTVGLGELDGLQYTAMALNDAGQVAGTAYDANTESLYAFITGPNGVGMSRLGTLGGRNSQAYGINNAGQVVGFSEGANGFNYGFVTGPNGVGMTQLGTLGGYFSYASAINDAGQVAGWVDTIIEQHAFITGPNGAGMTDLGTNGLDSKASAINGLGQATGRFQGHANGFAHAFITGPDGTDVTDLGVLPDGWASQGLDINASGQVVGIAHNWGNAQKTFNTELAFVTGPNGEGMSDLNTLVTLADGVSLFSANAINDKGQIVAYGTDVHMYLLTPSSVPEPSTHALMMLGLAGLGFLGRQKVKSSAT